MVASPSQSSSPRLYFTFKKFLDNKLIYASVVDPDPDRIENADSDPDPGAINWTKLRSKPINSCLFKKAFIPT
jgi:hypothetical protein